MPRYVTEQEGRLGRRDPELTVKNDRQLVALEGYTHLALEIEVKGVFEHCFLFFLLICHQSVFLLQITVVVSGCSVIIRSNQVNQMVTLLILKGSLDQLVARHPQVKLPIVQLLIGL